MQLNLEAGGKYGKETFHVLYDGLLEPVERSLLRRLRHDVRSPENEEPSVDTINEIVR